MKTLFIIMLVLPGMVWAQQKTFLPRNVNHQAKNNQIPAISGDGRTMIFSTDYSNTGAWVLEVTSYKSGHWQDPKEITALDPMRLNNIGGYFLDNTGEAIWFSSRKPDGLGGYDIWVTTKGSSGWGRPHNPGKPLNSSQNEGDPSISPDKQMLYFMRCDKITDESAKGCQLYVSERNKGRGARWKEPQMLPSKLNVGNSLTPRILSDNKTLIFASDRPGGKGGLDLWMSTNEAEGWTDPVNLAYANTPGDDRFITMSLRTEQAFITRTNKTGYKAIAQLSVPEQYRPKDVIMMMGKVVDEQGTPHSLDIRINNQTTGKLEARVISDKNTGTFVAVLTEGSRYEITYEDRSGKLAFLTQLVNVEQLTNSRRKRPEVVLTTIKPGAAFNLGGVAFDTTSNTISASSNFEMLRLARLMKQHPDLHFHLEVYQENYKEDSIQYPWLTEVRYDSIRIMLPPIEVDSMTTPQKDSLLTEMNDSLGATTLADTTIASAYQARMSGVDSIETWHKVPVYHNNRTPLYAETLRQQLLSKGLPENSFTATPMGVIPKQQKPNVVFVNGVAIVVRIE